MQELEIPLEQFAAMILDVQSALIRREMAKKAVARIASARQDGQERTSDE